MSWLRTLMGLAIGRRKPITRDVLTIPGLAREITIRRSTHGIPCIEAETDDDAAFAIGFCHAQDRGFQLETLLRIARGTMAELVGPEGLGIDRLSRRIGFRRAAEAQWPVLDADIRDRLTSYANGVNAGFEKGISNKPHEFLFLGGEPTPWQGRDVLAFGAFQSFMLPGNWDVELARLRIAKADGIDAVRRLDPHGPSVAETVVGSLPAAEALSRDLDAFRQIAPSGGGSNNWVLNGSRTKSGRPIVANDPHLSPLLPAPWYLVQVRLPDAAYAGATFAGSPALPCGHNEHAAWGVTAGLTDNTDLVIVNSNETGVSPMTETIKVKGGNDVVESIPMTAHGPVISPLLAGVSEAIAIKAIWLQPRPLRGFLDIARVGSFEEFRAKFRDWPMLPLNVVYADRSGTVGYQLIGNLPMREGHTGTMPTADAKWIGDVPFDQMPFAKNPETGFLATANAEPPVPGGAFLGIDFVDPFRVESIRDALSPRTDWEIADCQQLQMSVRSLPWDRMKDIVLGVTVEDEAAIEGMALLKSWDGNVTADSAAAAVFELFTADLIRKVAKSAAPQSWIIACGGDGDGPMASNTFAVNRMNHLVNLLRTLPAGWLAEGWPRAIEQSLAEAIVELRRRAGPSPDYWGWGHLRPLVLRHPLLGRQRYLRSIFNLGPIPCGGDANTINQAANPLRDVTEPTTFLPNMRAVMDVGDWRNNRFSLAGGQSGNPCSPHFDDLWPLWRKGEGVPIPFDRDDVVRQARDTLRLRPVVAESRSVTSSNHPTPSMGDDSAISIADRRR